MHDQKVIKKFGKWAFPTRKTFITQTVAKDLLAVQLIVILDLAAIAISLFIAYLIRNYLLTTLFPEFFAEKLLSTTYQYIWWYPLVLLLCLAYENLYRKRLPFWTEVERVFKANSLAFFFTIVLLYLAKVEDLSRSLILMIYFFSIAFIPLLRYYGKIALLKTNIWNRPVVLVGGGDAAGLVLGALFREKTMGYEVIGYIDEGEQGKTIARQADPTLHLPFLGYLDEAEKIVANIGIEDVIVAVPGLPSARLVELANMLQPLVNNVILVPDLFGLSLSGCIEVAYFFEEQAIFLHIKNRLKSTFNRGVKRAFDLLVGGALLFLSIPCLLAIAVAVSYDSKGPAFFPQKRLGQGGRHFTCYKFRTMYVNSDQILEEYLRENEQARCEWREYNKLKVYDPRLTRLGHILRRYSLDELPQLINIFLGHMSLIGPRPYLPREFIQMGSWVRDILVTKPGLTGLWQVSGRNSIDFEGRLKLDSWYMRNWSLWLDVAILIKTVRVVCKREGAY